MQVIGESLTFDDVLIVPVRSPVSSRRLVDISTRLTKDIKLNTPIVSAPMDTVTESAMAISLAREGGLGIIHRFMAIEEQCREVLKVKEAPPVITEEVVNESVNSDSSVLLKEALSISLNNFNGARPALDADGKLVCSAAVGLKDTMERSDALIKAGCDVLCLDIAHAHSDRFVQATGMIKKEFNVDIIAGNIATYEAAEDLISAGADIVKIGIGPGSTCTTRLVTGCGVPQLTAVSWVSEACRMYGATCIADGGMRSSGDLVKALAAGADCGMYGGLFSGTDEAPSILVIEGDKKYKICRGMASAGAMMRRLSIEDRQEIENGAMPEGAEIRVEYTGSISRLINQISAGLRSGLSYCGARTLKELRSNARFIKVSAGTQRESAPHNDFYV